MASSSIDISGTDTDRLLKSLEVIITKLKEKKGAIDFSTVKDGFDSIRFKINEKLKEAETYIAEREKLMTSNIPKEIMQRKQLENKVEAILDDLDKQLKDLNVELTAQKRKPAKYGNVENKEQMLKLMNERFSLIKNTLDGLEMPTKELKDNRTNIEKLDALLKERQENPEGYVERDLYDEEKQKMEEWDEKVRNQDDQLDEVKNVVKELRVEVKNAGNKIKEIGKKTNKVSQHADKSMAQLQTQNMKLKKLLEKLRSSSKICVDIILFLILIGLVAVLYSIIKNKWF